nr:uncharacterized protein LOC109774039 [Aegilops tauschii subsp. strangulata]
MGLFGDVRSVKGYVPVDYDTHVTGETQGGCHKFEIPRRVTSTSKKPGDSFQFHGDPRILCYFQSLGAAHSRGFSATTEHWYICISSSPANPYRLNHEVLGHQLADKKSNTNPSGRWRPRRTATSQSPNTRFSSWVTWLVGAFFLAAPAYWRFRALEDKAEQTAEATIEMVEKVAEAAERIADDVSEAFPGNERLKKVASSVKAVADEIEKDMDKAEAILHKVRPSQLPTAVICYFHVCLSVIPWYLRVQIMAVNGVTVLA